MKIDLVPLLVALDQHCDDFGDVLQVQYIDVHSSLVFLLAHILAGRLCRTRTIGCCFRGLFHAIIMLIILSFI